jgi:hypothetical protein
LKTLHKNRAGRVAQGEGPEFKPQYLKKKINKNCCFKRHISQPKAHSTKSERVEKKYAI